MDKEHTDMEINHAQQLLKAKHPKFNGFQSTLVVRKLGQFENNIQIVHCASRHHWIMATTVNCIQGEVKIFDSIFFNCDKETLQTIHTLFQHGSEHLTITNVLLSKAGRCNRLCIVSNCLFSGTGT